MYVTSLMHRHTHTHTQKKEEREDAADYVYWLMMAPPWTTFIPTLLPCVHVCGCARTNVLRTLSLININVCVQVYTCCRSLWSSLGETFTTDCLIKEHSPTVSSTDTHRDTHTHTSNMTSVGGFSFMTRQVDTCHMCSRMEPIVSLWK